MSTLYEEALIEAKKLKEIAEDDAKRAIVEDITPTIRRMITNELAGKSSPLFEEDDMSSSLGAGDAMPVVTAPIVASPSGDGADVSGGGAVAGGAMDAPIKATGADALNMPMPGPDGKLVIDFEDLFVPSAPGDDVGSGDEGAASAASTPEVPGGLPSATPVDVNPAPGSDPSATDSAPISAGPPGVDAASAAGTGALDASGVAPEEEPKMETYEMFQEEFNAAGLSVHKAYSSTAGVPSIVKEALQEKLFALVGTLETLSEKKLISARLTNVLENRLEIMHLKLKEAKVGNTYYRTEGTDMASKGLKAFAAKMLAESDTLESGDIKSPADSFKTEKPLAVANAMEKAADKAGAHAMKVTEPEVTLKTEAAAMAALEEELKSLVAESAGDELSDEDGLSPDAIGAASSIPDKKVGNIDVTKSTAASPTNKASHILSVSEEFEHNKATGSEEEVKKESVAVQTSALKEATKTLKAENLRKQIAALTEQLAECGMPEMAKEDSSLPAPGVDAKKSVMGEEDTIINFNFDLADLVPELSGMADDDEIEITDDGEGDMSGSDMSMGSSMEPEAGADADAGGMGSGLPAGLGGSDSDVSDKKEDEMSLAEAVKAGRGPVARKALAENRALKSQLAEAQLFNAKVVHLQPFMNNKNLTKEQKQKIVEYLDRGTTIDEVKTIYTKVKTVLDNAQKARLKAGSSSKVGTAGAASLQESADKGEMVNLYEGATLVKAERDRLMELAGIKSK